MPFSNNYTHKINLQRKVQLTEHPSALELQQSTDATVPKQSEAKPDVSHFPCCNQLFTSHTPSAGCPLTLARKLSLLFFFSPNGKAVQSPSCTARHQCNPPLGSATLSQITLQDLTALDGLGMRAISTLIGEQHHFCNGPLEPFFLSLKISVLDIH